MSMRDFLPSIVLGCEFYCGNCILHGLLWLKCGTMVVLLMSVSLLYYSSQLQNEKNMTVNVLLTFYVLQLINV